MRSDAASAWNFCARFLRRHEISAVFSGYKIVNYMYAVLEN